MAQVGTMRCHLSAWAATPCAPPTPCMGVCDHAFLFIPMPLQAFERSALGKARAASLASHQELSVKIATEKLGERGALNPGSSVLTPTPSPFFLFFRVSSVF